MTGETNGGKALSHSPLAERFWGLARSHPGADDGDPRRVVRQVLEILDALEAGERGGDVSVNTLSFLHMLRQCEIEGDLLYASPEQARGEQMDERSLVFSVGVLIFEKLTGRHPFGAEGNPRRLARIQKAEMASGVNYFQTINGPLRTILLKCMGPFPEERWSTMRQLRGQLEAFDRGAVDSRSSRSLPALPADPYSPSPTISPGGRASSHALGVAAEREVVRRQRSIAIPRTKGRSAWIQRGIWMACGAAAAGLIFLIAGGGGVESADPAAKAVAASEDRDDAVSDEALAATDDQAAAPEVERPAAGATPKAASKATPPAVPDASEAEVAPLRFDADALGADALQAIAPCTTGSGLVEVGATLVIDASGSVRRVFLGTKGLSVELRRCLHEELAGLAAAGPPDAPLSIAYRFRVGEGNVRWKELPPQQ